MIFKKNILLFLTALFLTQVGIAKPGLADSYTSMNNGILHYSEITDLSLTDININFSSGQINIVTQSNNGTSVHKKMQFDPNLYELPLNLKSTSFQSSQSNTEAIFNTNDKYDQINRKLLLKAGVTTKSSGCGAAAGRLLDLANRMIEEGKATGNASLEAFGRILRDIAIDMFQQCVLK